jgi:hypothetical protein
MLVFLWKSMGNAGFYQIYVRLSYVLTVFLQIFRPNSRMILQEQTLVDLTDFIMNNRDLIND